VYDDTKVLIEESQKLIKINQTEIKEKMKIIENEIKDIDIQNENFKSIYRKKTNDINTLELILEKERDLKIEKENNLNILNKLKVELEDLNQKYEKDKMELTYYDIKETVIMFFEKMNNDDKKSSLIKIIKKCKLYGKYIVIHTGKLLFIFNIDNENVLSEKTYKIFKKDKLFKDNFLNSSKILDDKGNFKILNDLLNNIKNNYYNNGDPNRELTKKELTSLKKELNENIVLLYNHLSVRELDNVIIQEVFLTETKKIDIKCLIENKLRENGIYYELFDVDKIISFTDFF